MLSRLLRLTAACGVAALAVLASLHTPASAANVWKQLRFQWNANGRTLDSLTANFAGISGTAGVCTTQAISTQDWDFATNSVTSFTSEQNYAKLAFTSSGAFGGDSLYYIMDYSVDGVNWQPAKAHTGTAAITAGDKFIAVNLTMDSNVAPLGTAGGIYMAPLLRLRLSGDAGGVKSSDVKVFINYPSTHDPYSGRANAEQFVKRQDVDWRFAVATSVSASGFVDSATVNFSGSARACTTQAVSMDEWEPTSRTGSAYTTSWPIAVLHLYTSESTNIDSISIAQDVSIDGQNWTESVSAAYSQSAGSGTQKSLTYFVNQDSDAGGANAWRWRFVRWRITGDYGTATGGVGASLLKALRAKLSYLSWIDPLR